MVCFCAVFGIHSHLPLTWRMSLKSLLLPKVVGRSERVTGHALSQFPLQGSLPQTIRLKLVPPLAFSLGICCLPFFFYKSKLKVTWGQCGRKVFIQVRQEHGSSFPLFYWAPVRTMWENCRAYWGQMFASKSMYVSMFLQLHPFCA